MKVCVETYGCTMNQGEGRYMEDHLISLGHQVVPTAEEADLVVLNTCTVIQTTENRMLRRLRELDRQGKDLVVSGCMAVVQPERLRETCPGAIVLPISRYDEFPSLIRGHFGTGQASAPPSGRVTHILPVAQGCRGHCTYCITRRARGPLTSRRPGDLIEEAQAALHAGCREIQLTAQDTAAYGMDLGTGLPDLLQGLVGMEGDFRVRVGMMNPDNLLRTAEDLLRAWRHPKVYKFLHLPVQSGSDAVLARMGRNYSVDDFRDLVGRFREACPDMTLSTDLIVGFPGEGEEDHRLSVELVDEIRPNVLNITRFSPRPGTSAADLGDRVPGWLAKERSRRLTDLRFRVSSEVNFSLTGSVETALVVERGSKGGVVARTDAYRPVVLHEDIPLGTFLRVRLEESTPTHFFGSRLDN